MHDILAAVAAEAAQAVEKRQVALRRLSATAAASGQRRVRLEKRESHSSARPRRSTCSASVPASSTRTTRATVCSSARSSSDICSPRRTKMPPGLSTSAASGLAATRSMIVSCSDLAVNRVVLVPDDQIDARVLSSASRRAPARPGGPVRCARGRGCAPARSASRRRCRNPTGPIARGGCGSARWPWRGAAPRRR